MYVPSMHAERALYRSPSRYVNVDAFAAGATPAGLGQPGARPSRSRNNSPASTARVVPRLPSAADLVAGSICSDLFYSVCEAEAVGRRKECLSQCDAMCGVNLRGGNGGGGSDPACEECKQNLLDCQPNYLAELRECQRLYVCDEGLECQTDLRSPESSICCVPGMWACSQECLAPCGSNGSPDVTACACICDDGFVPCAQSGCVDIHTDNENCGVCGKKCAEGLTCCNGSCQQCDNDECCGACQDCSAVGRSCCRLGNELVCASLFDDATCGNCQTDCRALGKVCGILFDELTCVCPSGLVDCLGQCCEYCCGGKCLSATALRSDARNCGKCGNVCFGGSICVAGKCQCQTGSSRCGGRCCPDEKCCKSASLCCTDKQTCIDNQCCDNVQVCGQTCCPEGERCVQGACCPSPRICGNNCCLKVEECVNGECCPPARKCGKDCCNDGYMCVDRICAKPCNSQTFAGGPTPEVHVIDIGRTSGYFKFAWNTYEIPDRLEVWYENLMLDGACVSGAGEVQYPLWPSGPLSGQSRTVTVKVFPNCDPNNSDVSTKWNFTVGCATADR